METIAQIPARFGAGVLLIEHNMRVVMGICTLSMSSMVADP